MRVVDRDNVGAAQEAHGFVGRHTELGVLLASAVEAGAGAVVRRVVTGEHRVGRTALLERFSALSRARAHTVISVNCRLDVLSLYESVAHQIALPQPVASAQLAAEQAGTAHARVPSPSTAPHAPTLLSGPHGYAPARYGGAPADPSHPRDAASFGADLRGHFPTHPSGAGTAAQRGPAPTCERARALAAAVARIAGPAPLVFAVDDLDLADERTATLLDSLVRPLRGTPVVFVAALQDGRATPPLPAVSNLLLDSQPLRLEGLSVSDATLLARRQVQRALKPEASAALHRVCAGNPGLLTDFLSLFAAQAREFTREEVERAILPDTMENILRRLARDLPAAADVFVAAAVAGDTAEPRLLAHLCDLDLAATMRAADHLVRMRYLRDDGTLLPRHPVLRNSALAAMTYMARDSAHLKAAEFLHRTHAPVEDIARHLAASSTSPDGAWPTALLMEAGRAAAAAGRRSAALGYVGHAARTASGSDRDRTLVALADLRMADSLQEGAEECLSALRSATDETSRAWLLAGLGGALYLHAPERSGMPTVDLIEQTVASDTVRAWARLHRLVVNENAHSPRHLAARAHQLSSATPRGAHPLGTGIGAGRASDFLRPAVDAFGLLNRYLTGAADPDSAAAEADQLLGMEKRICAHPFAPIAALMVLVWNDRFETAAGHVERLESCTPALGNYLQRTLLLSIRARIALADGDIGRACEQFEHSLERLARVGTARHNPFRIGVLGAYAGALLEAGDQRGAHRLLYEDESGEAALPVGWQYGPMLLARSGLSLVEGDFSEALRHLAEARMRARAAGILASPPVPWRLHGIPLLHQLGRGSEAREWAEQQIEMPTGGGTQRERGIALRVLGAVLGGGEGEGALREAVELLDAPGSRLQLAHATADLGLAVADQGRWEEAGGILGSALSLADACGAAPLATKVRRRLTALGGTTSGPLMLRAVAELTPREKQALVGALRGLSNTTLASELHVTKRTVEIHLSAAYRKLGIRGRKDFGQVFRIPGLWPLLLEGDRTQP
ncbi:AAA family ATPase [Streptomyces sp. NPDC001185]|uniref:helix-turn-helix transcriptional regulator n=1 Tax=Streptomyces sp. NPDC001185 TaxID=3154380 RepID=UPI00332F40D4